MVPNIQKSYNYAAFILKPLHFPLDCILLDGAVPPVLANSSISSWSPQVVYLHQVSLTAFIISEH